MEQVDWNDRALRADGVVTSVGERADSYAAAVGGTRNEAR
jgi:hypothetical protein